MSVTKEIENNLDLKDIPTHFSENIHSPECNEGEFSIASRSSNVR
jgi:hypothetical protein